MLESMAEESWTDQTLQQSIDFPNSLFQSGGFFSRDNATVPISMEEIEKKRKSTLTEVGVLFFLGSRTGSRSVISFHLLPRRACDRKIMKSSSTVKGEWSILGLKYSFHLSRHCLALIAERQIREAEIVPQSTYVRFSNFAAIAAQSTFPPSA